MRSVHSDRMGCGIEPRKKECCGGRDARNRRRQYVRHRYARCRRSAGVEGHITSERNASEPERSHVRPQVAEPAGPHREGEEPKPMMHGHEKSDSAIVATKPPNNAGRPAAEAVERRAEAKENANRCCTCRTQGRASVSPAPERVRTAARPAVNHPRWEPCAGKLPVRFWCSEASCHSSGCKSRQQKESSPCCSYIQRQ